MTTFTFATDLHGIEQDAKAVAAFLRFTDDFKPKLRVFGGDLWNFAALRRGADEDEKRTRLAEDFAAGLDFLEVYQPDVLLLGNHDQRLWDSVVREGVSKSGWLAELAGGYIDQFNKTARKLKIQVRPYNKRDGVYRNGNLAFAHGFGHGATLAENMAKAYGNVVFGHGHKIERVNVMQAGTSVTAYESGALCKTDMDYVRADLSALRQEHGFAYGVVGPTPEVFQARITNGKALVATGFKVV